MICIRHSKVPVLGATDGGVHMTGPGSSKAVLIAVMEMRSFGQSTGYSLDVRL